jgi:hypothetical protein
MHHFLNEIPPIIHFFSGNLANDRKPLLRGLAIPKTLGPAP